MYPFTSRGDPHHHQQQQNLSMNSLGFRVSAAAAVSAATSSSAAVSLSTIPTCFLPLNYSSSLRDCTSVDPLRAAAAAAATAQSYRTGCNPSSWPRDHEEHNNNNIPVNTNNNAKGLTSPEREVHHHLTNSSNNNNSTSGSMLNCGNTSLSMGAVRMKKKVRRKVREPRFCFKTLSDVDVLDDGYKWRKYGQKVVKNTQHPRSYYRCTQDNCRVKKRIERLAEDPRMVITTYEGRHAHSPSHDDEEPQSSSQMNFLW